ncbi:hypothetical protein PR048_005143 [Dryococelus australis]|uniref:Uncharacterized protein n=1 Tax=Dryococelus australis TaxID=614101 RepID=A0ABQ9I7D5_9NEOP|nr:hypothetical protein PR048_005143 [Dryococelus australis]
MANHENPLNRPVNGDNAVDIGHCSLWAVSFVVGPSERRPLKKGVPGHRPPTSYTTFEIMNKPGSARHPKRETRLCVGRHEPGSVSDESSLAWLGRVFRAARLGSARHWVAIGLYVYGLKKFRVIIVKKGISCNGVAPEDAKGRHANHPQVPECDTNIIMNHIKVFPAYISHYSRTHTHKVYLIPDLSISKMFCLYQDYCNEQSVLPRNEALHRKIFVEEFNFSFKKPKNDTCGKCVRFELVLKSSKDVVELEQVEKEKKVRLELAEKSCEEKKKDKLHSKRNCSCITMSFDHQKCLPTPLLMSGAVFYKRQLWTFNLTIYETGHKKSAAICLLWDETVAEREPGHSHMEADAINAAIEKTKKKNATLNVELPRDLANLIRITLRVPPITVTEVEQKDFLNFKEFLGNSYIHLKVDTKAEKFLG